MRTISLNNKILFNSISLENKNKINKSKYLKNSFFQNQVYRNKYFYEVDIAQYAISLRLHIIRILYKKKLIKNNFNGDLENLHKYINNDLKNYNFGTNKLSTFFYNTDRHFKETYIELIKFLRKKYLKFNYYYQKTPTIRLPMPGGKNRNHFPHYHSDLVLGHPFEMVNIWIPLTVLNKKDFHSFTIIDFINSKKILDKYNFNLDKFNENKNINNQKFNKSFDKFAFKVNTQFGKALIFDSRCLHSPQEPLNQTRVSIDTRILPDECFKKSKYYHIGHGRKKAVFTPGNNYSKEIIC